MDLNGYKEIRDAYRNISESAIDMPPANAPSAADPDPTKPFPKDREARAKAQAPKSTAPVKKEEAELDTFDVILEYLMGRGFPQEDAIQLMATMDDEKRSKILGEAKDKEKAAKDGHAAALYKDQWKDRDIADYDKEHGKDERAKEMRADAGEDRKRMKELDPDWKHAKDATGEEKGKKNYKDKKKVAEAAWDKYGRPKTKEGKAKAARAQAEMRAKDKASGRDRYGYKTGYAKKTWDE